MKLRFLIPLLALSPAFNASECPGCSLDISPPTTQDLGGGDPDCDTTVTVDIWSTGGSDGSGSCVLAVDIETGETECKQAQGCTIGWSFGVTTNSGGGSCTGVNSPSMSWTYDSGSGSFGQQGQDFSPDSPQTGRTILECGSVSTISVVHDGSLVYQTATCSACPD